jgi:hypothetical protein
MDMVFICSNLQKLNLIPLLNFQTHFFERLVYFLINHYPAILGWKHQMVEQDRNVMTFMDILTHPCILRPKGRGIYPKRLNENKSESHQGCGGG